MFDIGFQELLVIVIVAVLVIGPKDMPMAMRTAGRWIGKVRKVSSHFRTGIDAMVREAELEDMEKKWKAQNEEIMRRSAAATEANAGEPVMTGPPPVDAPVDAPAPQTPEPPKSDTAESAAPKAASDAVDDAQPKPAPGAETRAKTGGD